MVCVLTIELHGSKAVCPCGNKLKYMPKERVKKHFRIEENEIKGNRENYPSKNFVILLY
jgi:hypothetical protein